ncbi:hypothetical protein [Streptomyces sp. SCL15-6]|uniref:hypothetical protein n=1 Tax=Streptomyces sp. SCL15-6 TaxID=2967222 RepID=UPI0029666754|nr:hypothetical protein [Streptomyces sp. SCL15-6]
MSTPGSGLLRQPPANNLVFPAEARQKLTELSVPKRPKSRALGSSARRTPGIDVSGGLAFDSGVAFQQAQDDALETIHSQGGRRS